MEQFSVIFAHLYVQNAHIEKYASHVLVFRQIVVLKADKRLVQLHQALELVFTRPKYLKSKLADGLIVLVEVVEQLLDVLWRVGEVQVLRELPIDCQGFIGYQ